MSEIDYASEIKKMVYGIGHIRMVSDQVDEHYCCKYHGVSTYLIGRKLGLPTGNHRNQLKQLEKEGKFISYKWAENQILWWPVGFLEEISKS